MSNPLRWFRQNSKILVVFLGIGAMAIFGLGPAFDVLSRSSTYAEAGENPTVATWSGGEITRQTLDTLRYRHYDLMRFQEGLVNAAVEQVGDEYQQLVQPIGQINGRSTAEIDNKLINRLLLAQKASKEGFVISDDMVNEYLYLLAGNAKFSPNDLEQINNVANNRRASLALVLRQLKLELLFRQMDVMAGTGMPIIPNPTEAMELHGKVTSRVECEVIPVAVSQFAGDVAEEPSNSELRSLYKQGQFEYPDSTGRKPGFKIGRQLVAQYFVADNEAFLQNEMNKLSDADVQKEYERLVEAKDDLVMDVIPDEVDEVMPPTDENDTEKSEESDGQSINVRKSKSAFVSYRPQESEADTAAKPESGSTATTEEPVASEPVDVAQEASEAVADAVETKSDTESTVESTETPEEKTEATDSEKPADEAGESDEDSIGPLLGDLPKLNKKAKPLREVEDAVRRRMSQDAAKEEVRSAVEKAVSAIADFRMAYMSWKANEDSDNGNGQPAPTFDFETIAQEYNLIAKETPLVDDEGLSEEQLGKVQALMPVRMRNGRSQPQIVRIGEHIFNGFEGLDEYEAQTVQDFGTQSVFVYWLSDKRQPRVPTFEECRDQIVAFWSNQKALELAQEEAQRLVDSMDDKRGDLLSDVYPDRTFPTGEFTWFSNYGRPAISNVVGVSNPGDDFMKTVFGLERYGVSSSVNASRDTVYVVQRVSEERGVDEVAKDYMENQYFKFKTIPTQVRDTAAWYRREMQLDWADGFAEEMDYNMVGY